MSLLKRTIATKSVAECFTLSGTPPQVDPSSAEGVLQTPARPRYPLQMLSHCYVPFGVKSHPRERQSDMDVDMVGSVGLAKSKKVDVSGGEETATKKRKKESGQDDTAATKKPKRVKKIS